MSGVPRTAGAGRNLDWLEPGTAARACGRRCARGRPVRRPAARGGDWVGTFTSVAIYSVVAAGLGVLYGRVGMISLCQIGLLAIGTWVGARLAYGTSLPFPFLLLATGVITAAVGRPDRAAGVAPLGAAPGTDHPDGRGAITEILNQTRFPNGGGGFKGLILSARPEGDPRRQAAFVSPRATPRTTATS